MQNIYNYLFILFVIFGFAACESVEEKIIDHDDQNLSRFKFDTQPKEPETAIPAKKDENSSSDIHLSKMKKALLSGDMTELTEEELIDETLNEIDNLKSHMLDAKIKIFNLNSDATVKSNGASLTSIDWDPTHDACLFDTSLGVNVPVFVTNSVANENYSIYEKTIAAVGKKGGGRYMVFGTNPLRVIGNRQMQQAMENAISWLVGRDDLKNEPFSVVIAHLDDSFWFRDESKTREWLDKHFNKQAIFNEENSCEGENLQSCLDKKTDLLILSQVSKEDDNISRIIQTVDRALQNDIPILYIHHDGDLKALGKELFAKVFDIKYVWDNYWKKLTLKEFDPSELKIPRTLAEIEKIFKHFKADDYSIKWSECKNGKCDEASDFKEEFLNGAKKVKEMLSKLDRDKIAVFDRNDSYRFQKLLILSGDKLRQSVSYPMDKIKNDDNEFLKSLYADYAVYDFRKTNFSQPDTGNFSRSDFSTVLPHSARVKMKSKKYFKAAGIYALPGESMVVRRYDDSNLSVKVFINSLRASATHEFETDGYKRPKFLQTAHFEIEPNETIVITSAYGGPVQLEFDKNDLLVDLGFENIAEHPFWSGENDSSEFARKLQEAKFDWAEIVTDGFEIHSTLEKLKESLSDERWESVEDFANATKTYISNYPHILAGFQAEGIDEADEVVSFAKEHNLTIEKIDIVKHMNADQATCGYGCSGNPYDAYWAFSPVAHGDLHELGHGLESDRFRFEGFSYHSTTNPYSYYSKSKYFESTRNDPQCQKLPFKDLFENIRKSLNQSDPLLYLKNNFWNNSKWSHQVLVTIEAMMHAQKMGKLRNGWHLLSRLHLLDREIKRVKNDWENKKASIGFDGYSWDEFNSMRKNDWLLVSFSFASGLDFRDYFNMMGIEYSQKASDQVESFAYERVPAKLFVSTPDGYCKKDEYGDFLDKTLIDVKEGVAFAY